MIVREDTTDETLRPWPHDPTDRPPQYRGASAAFHVPIVPRPGITVRAVKLAPFLEHLAENLHGFADLGALPRIHARHLRRQFRDAPPSRCLEQPRAAGAGPDAHASGVRRIFPDYDQPAAGQSGDDPAHRRRLDLFGRGQLAQRLRASEHQHRQRRKARRAFAAHPVLLADPSQQMDRRRVQPVGNDQRFFRRTIRMVCGVILGVILGMILGMIRRRIRTTTAGP